MHSMESINKNQLTEDLSSTNPSNFDVHLLLTRAFRAQFKLCKLLD